MTEKDARKLMKLHGHKFKYCSCCGPTISCGYCGRNVCSNMPNEDCKDNCKEAYAIDEVVKNPWYHWAEFYCKKIIPTLYLKHIRVPIAKWFYKRKRK